MQLQISAETGNLDRMTAALSAGANIESRDNRKQTPLHLAAKNGHLQCLEFLLDNLANLEALDEYRQTPIFSAAGTENTIKRDSIVLRLTLNRLRQG